MNTKIVLFTDIYYPRPMAGGICAHEIAKGLKEIGYEVHVVCLRRKNENLNEMIDGINVHRIRMPLVYRIRDLSDEIENMSLKRSVYNMAITINRLLKIFFLRRYPLMSPLQILAYARCAKRINARGVIAFYFSIESAMAGKIMKEKYKMKYILYMLDSLSNCDSAVGLPDAYIRKKGLQWEKQLFPKADGIIIMNSHRQHYENKIFDTYRKHFFYAGLPLVYKRETEERRKLKGNGRIKLVYSGTLSNKGRNPRYLLQIFEELGDENLELHFFSKGDCEKQISDYQKKTRLHIVRHGHVAKGELDSFITDCDILINIGNSSGDFVPSKLLEYISNRKPLIHISFFKEDPCICLLKRYPMAYVLQSGNTLDEKGIADLKSFIKNARGVELNQEEILYNFREYTRDYSVALIKSIL